MYIPSPVVLRLGNVFELLPDIDDTDDSQHTHQFSETSLRRETRAMKLASLSDSRLISEISVHFQTLCVDAKQFKIKMQRWLRGDCDNL